MLITGLTRTLTTIAAVGAASMGGVFLAFSTFVMPGLGRLRDRDGIAAMQAINVAAPRSPVFMGALFGTAIVAVVLAVPAFKNFDDPQAHLLLVGAGLYLVCIVLTAGYHVPHNDALAALDPAAPGSAEAWRSYLRGWTAWNHVRALAPLAASVTYLLALRTP